MKNCKAMIAALLIGACPAAWAQYSAGTNQLAHTNISAALADFTSAAPTDPNARVYLALTRLLALPNQPTGSNFLNRLRLSRTTNVYDLKLKPIKNASGKWAVNGNLDADEFTAELRKDILPALGASGTNLAQITDPAFTLFMPGSVTHFGDVTIDYGDVQMLRAILDAATVFGYTLHTWNLNAQFAAVTNIVQTDQSIQAVLSANPGLLTITNTSDLAPSRAAFTNAISCYMAASQFIRNRPPGEKRLFNLDTNDLNAEANFRTFISDLESSLNTPFGGPGSDAGAIPGATFFGAIRSFTNHTVSLANFFNGDFNLRSLLPTLTTKGFTFIWDSFPDPTLGGVLTGLTETNLGKAFLKGFHANAQLSLPGVTCAVVGSVPKNFNLGNLNGVVLGADGNFYGTTTYGGAAGYGTFYQVTPAGAFKLLYSFGKGTNPQGGPVDGGQPSSPVLGWGSDHNFYGTTGYGGSSVNSGTIFKMTPGGSLTTLYTFGQTGDGYSQGGNPLVLGSDGNFYGTTPTGGANGSGIIFQIASTPPYQFSLLYSFAPATDLRGNRTIGAGALVQGSDGNFYGATQYGGDFGSGSIFQFIPASAANGPGFNTVYSFPALSDVFGDPLVIGVNNLMQASNGMLYGTTEYGGANDLSAMNNNGFNGGGDGALFSINSQGLFSILYSFDQNGFDGFNPIGALVQGTNGALYGITASGGANGGGTIFQFTPDAAIGFLVWFDKGLGEQQGGQNSYNGGYYNDFAPPVGLVAGGGGFYGTAPNGGANGNGTVFSLGGSSLSGSYPPSIATPPASLTGVVGASATLTVSAGGTPPLSYQWKRNGTLVGGATTASLTLPALTLANAGSYVVVVKNPYGSATSAVAVLTVLVGPVIKSQPPATVTILQGQPLNLKVSATDNGLSYQWSSNTVNLTDGGTVSGSATSNLVINPAVIGNSASYSVLVSNSIGAVPSHVSIVTVQADAFKPAVTITAPAANARSNAPVTFRGTASEATSKGGVLVTNVTYWITNLNGSPTTSGQAVLAAGPGSVSNWTASVSPPAGSNVLAVQSRDFSGNTSAVVSLKFFLLSPVPLTVATAGTGNGTVKGASFIHGDPVPTNGGLLNVGEVYSITATPGTNSFYINWTGTAGATNGPTLKFIMESNTSLTANFITNIFVQMAGTYNGLFSSDALGVTEETAGLIGNLILKTNGAYSTTFHLPGSAPAISGSFAHDGSLTTNVATTQGKVKLQLTVNANTSPRTITASVTGTNHILANGIPQAGWASAGTLFASLANTHADAGAYTLLIPPAPQPLITTPPGNGSALLANNPGTASVLPYVTLTGALADGAPIIQNVGVGEDNGIPVYLAPYSNNASGLLWGRLSLSNTPAAPAPSGTLTWIRKASASPSGLFKAGFTNTSVAVLGSTWSNSLPILLLPNSQLVVSNNGAATPLLAVSVSLNKTNLVPSVTTPNYTSGSINTNTGRLTVIFTNSGVRVTGQGAFLQNAGIGGGSFILPPSSASPTNAGSITLQP